MFCPGSGTDKHNREAKGNRREKMNKRKLGSFALCAMLFALCSSADAQQAGKIFRIGFLDSSNASGSAVLVDAFRQELSKLGWIEGKNITIEYRFAEQKPERVPELAAELVRLKVDVIVGTSPGPALAAKKATTTIPIVVTSAGDPVGAVWSPVWRGLEAMSPGSRVYRAS